MVPVKAAIGTGQMDPVKATIYNAFFDIQIWGQSFTSNRQISYVLSGAGDDSFTCARWLRRPVWGIEAVDASIMFSLALAFLWAFKD